MASDYAHITGDPDDYTLDKLEEQLGREVDSDDIETILDDLRAEYARWNAVGVNGPTAKHLYRKGLNKQEQVRAQKKAASIKRRIAYYEGILANWP